MARRQNAYSQLIQEGKKQDTQTDTTVADSNTLKSQNGTIPQSSHTGENRKTAKNSKTVKITIYPSLEQREKLYDFMEVYRKKTGMKINQQDLIRRIIDVADINTVLP